MLFRDASLYDVPKRNPLQDTYDSTAQQPTRILPWTEANQSARQITNRQASNVQIPDTQFQGVEDFRHFLVHGLTWRDLCRFTSCILKLLATCHQNQDMPESKNSAALRSRHFNSNFSPVQGPARNIFATLVCAQETLCIGNFSGGNRHKIPFQIRIASYQLKRSVTLESTLNLFASETKQADLHKCLLQEWLEKKQPHRCLNELAVPRTISLDIECLQVLLASSHTVVRDLFLSSAVCTLACTVAAFLSLH